MRKCRINKDQIIKSQGGEILSNYTFIGKNTERYRPGPVRIAPRYVIAGQREDGGREQMAGDVFRISRIFSLHLKKSIFGA